MAVTAYVIVNKETGAYVDGEDDDCYTSDILKAKFYREKLEADLRKNSREYVADVTITVQKG